MVKKFNIVTPELYEMAKTEIARYDDIVSFGYGDCLNECDYIALFHAEVITKIYQKENN